MNLEKQKEILKDATLKKLYEELEYENKKILELQWELATIRYGVAGITRDITDDLKEEINNHVSNFDKTLRRAEEYVAEYKMIKRDR